MREVNGFFMYLTEEDNFYRDVISGLSAGKNKSRSIETYHLYHRTVSIHLMNA